MAQYGILKRVVLKNSLDGFFLYGLLEKIDPFLMIPACLSRKIF